MLHYLTYMWKLKDKQNKTKQKQTQMQRKKQMVARRERVESGENRRRRLKGRYLQLHVRQIMEI